MLRLAVRSRLVALTILLIGTVGAMHSLAMPEHPMSPVPSLSMASEMVGHVGANPTTASSPMSACASTHCAAARGADAVAAHAVPAAAFHLPTAASGRPPAVDTAATGSRAPPRSGSCSPLCVWRQ